MKKFLWIVKTMRCTINPWFFWSDCITQKWTHEWMTKADSEQELREYLNAKYDGIISIYIKEQ